jgi:glycine/D-amino acid oxidase-like deaminating enzyme
VVGKAEVAVVGAGIVGLATARALADRGVRVAIYERGVPGNGQSGGDSRIFRHAHADPRLVALACESRSLWRQWEERCGRELVSADGVVSIGPDVAQRAEAMRAGGARARLISASELGQRLPLLAPWDGEALLDEDGGVIRTRTAIELLSEELGDVLVRDEVLSVRSTAAGTGEVRAGAGTVQYGHVVVCAGQETRALARGAGFELPVRRLAHVRLAFGVRGPAPQRVACLLDGSGAFGEATAYADPLPGNGLYAVGVDEAPVHAEGGLTDPEGLTAIAQRTARYVAAALPGLEPAAVQARHCWITELPWGHDAFAAWGDAGTSFFAGHNLFKHAPALGRALAARALGEAPGIPLDPEDRLGAPASASPSG